MIPIPGKKNLSLYGIFGFPLKHSLSPAMQESAFLHLGISAHYLTLELNEKNFRSVLSRRKNLPLEGFNVTIPYKEKVIGFLDRISPEARRIGAVNTVYRKKGLLIGTNTDAAGFLQSLEKDAGFFAKGKSAVVLGAGGAARAAVYGLAKKNIRSLTVLNRNLARAETLVDEFKRSFPRVRLESAALNPEALAKSLPGADLIVNATSIGLKKNEGSVIPEKMIPLLSRAKARKLFYDLIYFPAETAFLKAARMKGHQTLNGTGMLVYQGAKAFECWTGQKAPVDKMRRALLHALSEREAA